MHRAVYRRFDDYDGDLPAIESFSLEIFVTGFGRSDVLPWALERGHVDAIVESWTPAMSRVKAKHLAEEPGFERIEGPGSAVVFLAFNFDRAPFDDVECRRFIADGIDRTALVDYAEQGFADAVDTFFAPGVADWPDRAPAPPSDPSDRVPDGLVGKEPVLLVSGRDPASMLCAIEIVRQFRERGVYLRVETAESGSRGWDRVNRRQYDLHLTRTWGLPYDPHATLRARLMPQPEFPTAVETVPYYADPDLTHWIAESSKSLRGTPEREKAYGEIQAHLDRHVVAVPLYIPRRIAMTNPRVVQGLALGPHGYGLDLSHAIVKE
jgi:ABC-type transport system substrate-binding protein